VLAIKRGDMLATCNVGAGRVGMGKDEGGQDTRRGEFQTRKIEGEKIYVQEHRGCVRNRKEGRDGPLKVCSEWKAQQKVPVGRGVEGSGQRGEPAQVPRPARRWEVQPGSTRLSLHG